MYFLFIMTSLIGGFMAGRGVNNKDLGIAILGVLIVVISVIASSGIGFPL